MYKKVTPQQTKEMKMFKKLGWTNKKISFKYNISEGTVSNHILGRKGKCHKRDGIGDNPEEIPLFIRQNIARAKFNEPTERIKRGACKICGKEKEKKFHLTRYCSLKCFALLTTNM